MKYCGGLELGVILFLAWASVLPPSCSQPPVQVYGIEGRYATALYSAASKENKLDQVEKELLRMGVRSPLVGRVPVPSLRLSSVIIAVCS